MSEQAQPVFKRSSSFQEKIATERKFHDDWAETIKPEEVLVRESFEVETAVENRFILSLTGEIAGKRLLDVGCGSGEAAVYFAQRGAKVTALDISGSFLRVVTDVAKRHAVPVSTLISPVEFLPFRDGTFDIVYGNSVLHHLEFQDAMREIHRVLRPGGKAFFIEPLAYNPVINIYRRMAGTLRTPDERPIFFSDLRWLRTVFAHVEHREFWLFAQLVFVWFFVGMRVHPSRERYWKKMIYDADKVLWLFQPLHRFDQKIQKWLPLLNRMCWNTVISLRK